MKQMTINIREILSPDKLVEWMYTENIYLEPDPEIRVNVQQNRDYLEKCIADPDGVYYGINTGFGSLCNIRISDSDLEKLQENLVLSHACGAGDPVPESICRLILYLKIRNLCYAVSGVRMELIDKLIILFNKKITPLIYELGSLGASGDLAPLAHLSLVLLGKGKVYHNGQIRESVDVLAAEGIKPIKLKAKEGLALLNGTQFSLAYAIHCQQAAVRYFKLANTIAALSMEAFHCDIKPFTDLLHHIRPHQGQAITAARIYSLLKDSPLRKQELKSVQDPYSFRCVPQVHGASWQAIQHAGEIITTELNSVTDNPMVFDKEDSILSGGNFHAQPLALVLDYLAIALAELGSISERRVYQLINGDRDLPLFLTSDPGLNSGFMIAQYTAASIVSQNKQLCTPASVDSIVSSKGQEDHVSMAANAGTKCLRIVRNLKILLGIELLTAAQAFEYRRPQNTSPELEQILAVVRENISFSGTDRLLHDDIVAAENLLDHIVEMI
jgi:histidine ammonia-lyase